MSTGIRGKEGTEKRQAMERLVQGVTMRKQTKKGEKPVEGNGYLEVEDVAKRLNVSESWVYKKIRTKVMPHIRIGGIIRVPEKELLAWVEAHAVEGCPKV